MTTPGYRTCRKPGCGGSVKHGKRLCLRCGTPVEVERFGGTGVPAASARDEMRRVKLARFWR